MTDSEYESDTKENGAVSDCSDCSDDSDLDPKLLNLLTIIDDIRGIHNSHENVQLKFIKKCEELIMPHFDHYMYSYNIIAKTAPYFAFKRNKDRGRTYALDVGNMNKLMVEFNKMKCRKATYYAEISGVHISLKRTKHYKDILEFSNQILHVCLSNTCSSLRSISKGQLIAIVIWFSAYLPGYCYEVITLLSDDVETKLSFWTGLLKIFHIYQDIKEFDIMEIRQIASGETNELLKIMESMDSGVYWMLIGGPFIRYDNPEILSKFGLTQTNEHGFMGRLRDHMHNSNFLDVTVCFIQRSSTAAALEKAIKIWGKKYKVETKKYIRTKRVIRSKTTGKLETRIKGETEVFAFENSETYYELKKMCSELDASQNYKAKHTQVLIELKQKDDELKEQYEQKLELQKQHDKYEKYSKLCNKLAKKIKIKLSKGDIERATELNNDLIEAAQAMDNINL